MPSRTRVAPLMLLAALAACGERSAAPTATGDPGLSAARTAAPEPDRQRLEQLARRLASALSDPAFRLRLKQELDHSPVREHKLHFQRLLTAGASPAAAEIARATGAPAATVTAEALAAPALELYLPVPEHRARWTGDDNVLVATALHDHEPPVAFDPAGRRQLLDPDTPPGTPVLALVPVETDFDQAESGGGVGEAAIEVCPQTAAGAPAGEVQAQACQGTGGGTPVSGLWMTAAWFVGTFEGWLKGAPEFEVHMLGQAGATDSLRTYQCAGEKQPVPYWFDQNSTTWTGSVLLASQSQIDAYKQQHPGQSLRTVVIEDDDTACQVKMDADRFKTIITLIDSYNSSYTGGRDTTTGLVRVWNRAKAIQKILQAIWSFITTQDEFVGNAVQDAVAGVYKPGYNWIVKGENNVTNGALKLEMR